MRIGKVVGRLVCTQLHESLVGGRFLIVEVQDRFALIGQPRRTTELAYVYDNLGGRPGDTIGFTESREATMPFYPEKRVPLDAYNACILDQIVVGKD